MIFLASREEDPMLIQKRSDIIHTAAVILEKCALIRYDRKTGVFRKRFESLDVFRS